MTSSGPGSYAQVVPEIGAIPRPAPGYPAGLTAEQLGPSLHISVIFTSVEATRTALERAWTLAGNLGARIALLVPQVVPFPLPLEKPAVPIEWNEARFREIAGQSPVETAVHIYLCRDAIETLTLVLRSGSIVVVGCKCKRWLSSEVRLARRLRRLGHEVILTEKE